MTDQADNVSRLIPKSMKGQPTPDRVDVYNKDSPFYWPVAMAAQLGVAINGEPGVDVVEFCVSGGWYRVLERDAAGMGPKIRMRYGKISVSWL